MNAFLAPIERPKGLMKKQAYYFTRKQFGKVLTPLKVHNVCRLCMDIDRAFVIKASMNEAKFNSLDQYRASSLFSDAACAALDYVTVASEHLYNITNIGLNIHSDMLCDISKKRRAT